MLWFPLTVGVSPCFHCTALVPVYRVYTSYFLKNYPVSEDVLNEQWEASKYETSGKELNHQKSKLIYSGLKARG